MCFVPGMFLCGLFFLRFFVRVFFFLLGFCVLVYRPLKNIERCILTYRNSMRVDNGRKGRSLLSIKMPPYVVGVPQ